MKNESLTTSSNSLHVSTLPDAYLLFADRMVVVDHQTNDIYIVAFSSQPDDEAWLHSTLHEIQRLDVSLSNSSASVSVIPKVLLNVRLIADYNAYTCKWQFDGSNII